MVDVDRAFAHDRMKKAKNSNKIENDYRVPILVAGGKVAAPHLLMPDKGEWNNS